MYMHTYFNTFQIRLSTISKGRNDRWKICRVRFRGVVDAHAQRYGHVD